MRHAPAQTRTLLLALTLAAAYALVNTTTGAGQASEFGPPYTVTGGFENPFGVAVDPARGHLLVADTRNRRVRWAAISTLAAAPAFSTFGFVADADSGDALLDPQGLAADNAGNVYVVDARRGAVKLYRWDDSAGNYVLQPAFVSPALVGGGEVRGPRDIAVGPDGGVYLLDSGRKRVLRIDGPADTTWEPFLSDASLANPYGIAVGPDGRVYVADTDNHRVVRYEADGTGTAYGRYGTGPGELRFPRDVAVDSGGRMYVADTHNHRLEILDGRGRHIFSLGGPPALGAVQKVVTDAERRIFVADSDRDAVVAFLGRDAAAPFDAWLRDYVGDTRGEPSDASVMPASPDILVRHAPDVDAEAAERHGLESIPFQQPRHERDNFVYVAVRNAGRNELNDAAVRLFWARASSATLAFPDEWSDAGFFTGVGAPEALNALSVPPVPAGGVRVVGPLRWRPPAPDAYLLAAHVVQPFDAPRDPGGLSGIRANNNVAARSVRASRGPFAAGEQNVLVVRVRYAGEAVPPDEAGVIRPRVEARLGETGRWVSEVSWGAATLRPLFYAGTVELPHNRAHYRDRSRTLLVEMATDALNVALREEPALLDGPTDAADDDITRVVLVTDGDAPDADWALTEPWPYRLPAGERYLTVSVQGADNTAGKFEHGLSHQFGLLDLYAYPNVIFPRPFADGWDNMARPFNGAHPLVWSKERAGWATTQRRNILFVPRPARGSTYTTGDSPLPLYTQATAAAGQPVGIAIGLTPRVGTLTDETAFYYLEVRSNTDANADSALPGGGVLMYYVNERIPQGQGPVLLRDHGAAAGLADAAIPAGEAERPEGTGISAAVRAGPPGGPPYLIDLRYTPPPTAYDVSIVTGDPPWTSPDIWVDDPTDGFDEEMRREPTDRGDRAVGGDLNRIYARIHNAGADAFNVEVAFFITEPHPTVGGEESFTLLHSLVIDRLPAGDTVRYVPWTPTVRDPHSCVRVVVRRLTDDSNPENNAAQQNIEVDWSRRGSPYAPVRSSFQIDNPGDTERLVYFRVDQLPRGWSYRLEPEKTLLNPRQRFVGAVTITPAPDAANCLSHDVYVSAWVPRGHTLVRLGGMTVRVNLANRAGLKLKLETVQCPDENFKAPDVRRYSLMLPTAATPPPGGDGVPTYALGKLLTDPFQAQFAAGPLTYVEQRAGQGACVLMHPKGCTEPAQPHKEILLHYLSPRGLSVYRTVQADAAGCFEDVYPVAELGQWEVGASTAAGNCLAPVEVRNKTNVVYTICKPNGRRR